MKITLVASECVPFIKTGGLADVVGALPAAEKELGAEVSVMIPKYSRIPEKYRYSMEHVSDFHVTMGWQCRLGTAHRRPESLPFGGRMGGG